MRNIEGFFKNIIYKNENLSVYDKESIEVVINKFVDLFDKFDIEIPIEEVAPLFSNLKIENNYYTSDINQVYYYDSNRNTIVHNKKNDNDDDKRFYDYLNVMLEMLSKRYDIETSKYSDGLIYEDEYGNKFGTKVNEKLKHTLIVLMTGEVIEEEKIKDFYVDKVDDPCTLEDCLLIDINSIISTEDLLTYFINADGISFYQTICNTLNGDEEKTKDFLSNIDEYTKDNSIEQRRKYDDYLEFLNQNKNTSEIAKKTA